MKYRDCNLTRIRAARSKAIGRLEKDKSLLAVECDAGFVMPPKSTKGYQVFVHVFRFDAQLLKEQPYSGGLVKYAEKLQRRKKK